MKLPKAVKASLHPTAGSFYKGLGVWGLGFLGFRVLEFGVLGFRVKGRFNKGWGFVLGFAGSLTPLSF